MDDYCDKRRDLRTEGAVPAASVEQALGQDPTHGLDGAPVTAWKIQRSSLEVTRPEILKRISQPPNRHAERKRHGRAEWTSELDGILRKGYFNGWLGKRWAANQILKLRPEWHRQVIWRRAKKLGLHKQQKGTGKSAPWSETEDRILIDHAGYDSVATIAELLNRTRGAVRCRLARLGASSRVSDAYTKTGLASLLHVSPKAVQRWIARGWLSVRNPRISASSLQAFISARAGLLGIKRTEPFVASEVAAHGEYTWAKAATYLGVERESVAEWIGRGWLKCCDPRITEKSLEDFCKNRGSEIRRELLAPDARQWLGELGLPENTKRTEGYDGRVHCKHARKVWRCNDGCRRFFRGNVYFKHLRSCPELKARHDSVRKTELVLR